MAGEPNESINSGIRRFSKVPGVSVHTMKLIAFLEPLCIKGTIVTDEQSADQIGMGVGPGDPGYNYLRSAMRIVSVGKSVNWSRMPGAKAIKCLNDSESVKDAAHKQKGIHRKSRRVMQSLHRVDTSKLQNGEVLKHHTLVAQVGTLMVFSSSDTTKKLEARNATKALDVGAVMDLMK